jgi:hypothetical protein
MAPVGAGTPGPFLGAVTVPTSADGSVHSALSRGSRGSRASETDMERNHTTRDSLQPSNYFDVTVQEHYVVGNGTSYDKHVFSICVTVEGLQYTVDRTYVDFVDLDRKLRKKFPRIKMPMLPLEAADFVAKVLAKEGGKNGKTTQVTPTRDNGRGSVALTRESLTSFTKDGALSQLSKSLRVLDGDMSIDDKVGVLDKYLKHLMSMHELLASDEILLFLDEEATSMSIDPNSLEPISAHDLLLLSSPTNSMTVKRVEDATFSVRPGQLVVWRFTTENYDIGFSVEMLGEVKVSYTRYNSHVRPVSGTVEANGTGICRLIWDNSYAKCEYLLWFNVGFVVILIRCSSLEDVALERSRCQR